tara:strand:+ start:610 stop:1452 length:843 start_codon:yes stop_codon:yes gene_type:complete
MNLYQIIVLLISILVIFYLKLNPFKDNRLKIQRQGLLNVRALKQLIYFIQQHRGMTAAYLNGKKEILTKIKTIRQHIQENIRENELTFDKDNERWHSFLDHWQRLSTGSASADNSFDQHTLLINNILYLLEDEAEKGLLFSQFLPQFPQAGYVWREVIGATEMIGQARAIGVSVATQKTCSSTDNIRLSFLQQQISEVSKTVLHQLYCLPQYLEEHNKLIKITQEQTAMFLSTVDQAFLSTNEITLDQQVYFEQATLVIQSIDDVFEHQLTQISNSLDVT